MFLLILLVHFWSFVKNSPVLLCLFFCVSKQWCKILNSSYFTFDYVPNCCLRLSHWNNRGNSLVYFLWFPRCSRENDDSAKLLKDDLSVKSHRCSFCTRDELVWSIPVGNLSEVSQDLGGFPRLRPQVGWDGVTHCKQTNYILMWSASRAALRSCETSRFLQSFYTQREKTELKEEVTKRGVTSLINELLVERSWLYLNPK